MNIIELRDKVIEMGLDSVNKTYKEDDPRRDGGIEGFNKAKELQTPDDFITIIQNSREKEIILRNSTSLGFDKPSPLYIKQRYITLQLEYVFEIMKVAWNNSTPKLYHFKVTSARATIQYSKIVGVKSVGKSS